MKTEIIMLTDVSGSMRPIDRPTCAAVNQFIAEQRELSGEARVTHLRFNTRVQTDFEGRLLQSVPQLASLNAGGGTALYDSIIEVIDTQMRRIARENWADQVIFVITTDGEDMDSRRTLGNARAAIGEARDCGWHFVFLGANINAEEVASALEIEVSFQFVATAAGVAEGIRNVSKQVRELRSWGL